MTPPRVQIKFKVVKGRCCCCLVIVSDSLQPYGLWPTRLSCPWNFPGKNAGVGCHFLLQGIFPTQELNWDLLHCWRILNQLSYQGSYHNGILLSHKEEWS